MRDIAEIRSMMERSSKFMSLSGWAGILAGFYALVGAFVAWKFLGFNPDSIEYTLAGDGLYYVFLVALSVLLLSICSSIADSYYKAKSKGQKAWNVTSRRLLNDMAVPMVTCALLIIILINYQLIGLIAPITLIFYGLAIYNASNFTFKVMRIISYVQIFLGLLSCCFIQYSLLLWATGFGLVHIIYGIYMFKYEQ